MKKNEVFLQNGVFSAEKNGAEVVECVPGGKRAVILSGASAESKDLRTYGTGAVKSVRRSFDSLQKSAIFSGRSG